MKMTKRIKNFIQDPTSFSYRKIANLCKEEQLDTDFMMKYKEFLNWKILLPKYKFTFDELDQLIPIIRKQRVQWEFMSTQTFSEEQLDKFIKERIYTTYHIFKHQKVSEKWIEEYYSTSDWGDILTYQKLSENFLRKHIGEINNTIYGGSLCWNDIAQYQHLSQKFMRDFKDKLDWHILPKYQDMSESFIKEFKDRFWWGDFPYDKLSEKLIEELSDTVCWPEVCKLKKNLSNEFIDKWAWRLDWFNLCYYNKVDSDTLMKHVDKLNFDWVTICDHQNLSETFIRANRDRVKWGRLLQRNILSYDFIREMKKDIGKQLVWVTQTNYVGMKTPPYSEKFIKEMKAE